GRFGPGDHAGQIFHLFYRAHDVAVGGSIFLLAGDVNESGVGELFRHHPGRVHVAKGGGEDDIEALAGQVADDPLGVGPFGHTFQISGVDGVTHRIFQIFTPFVVSVGPAAVTDG